MSSYAPKQRSQQRTGFWIKAGLFFFLTLIAGCMTSPSRVRVTLYPEPVYPPHAESQWAVLTWLLESDEGKLINFDRELARKMRDDSGLVVFAKWCRQIQAEYPFLQYLNGDLFFNNNVRDTKKLIQALDVLDQPIRVIADLDESYSFSWVKNLRNSSYKSWLREFGNDLYLPDEKYGNRYLATRNLKKTHEIFIVQTTIEKVDKLIAQGQIEDGFNLLVVKLRDFPENANLLTTTDTVADQLIKMKVEQIRKSTISEITITLGKLTDNSSKAEMIACEQQISAMENSFQSLYQSWLDNSAVVNALVKNEAILQSLLREIGSIRATIWQVELQHLVNAQQFWKSFVLFSSRLSEIALFDSTRKSVASEILWQKFLAIYPQIKKKLLDTAQQEIENGERHGVALIICQMIADMEKSALENGKKLPSESTDLNQRFSEIENRALQFFETWVKRKIILSQFTSGEAGLGTTFLRDLEILFRNSINASKNIYGVDLSEEKENIKRSDYLLTKCNVAAFEVDTRSPEEELVLVTQLGEIIEEENPEYLDRIKKKKVTTGIPQNITSQKIYRHTKHQKSIDIVVHSRLTFIVEHQDKNEFFEINKFLKKSFLQEKIDPRETVIKIEKVIGQPEPFPPLHVDEIMVSSEMKDWARKQAQEILAMNVMRYVADYPNWLLRMAETQERKGQWSLATNYWGLCLAYTQRINPDPQSLQSQLEDKNLPEHLRQEVEKNLRISKILQYLKQNVWNEAIEAYLSYKESPKS